MAEPRIPRAWGWALLPALLIVGVSLALLLVPIPAAWSGGWRSRVFDLGHVPLFAALTAALSWAIGGRWHGALLIALAVAALAEVAQHLVGRTAELDDFLLGGAGALAAGLILRAAQVRPPGWQIAGHVLAAGALVVTAAAGPTPRLIDAAEGFADFPTLADFQTERQMLRWQCQQAHLKREPDPARPGLFMGALVFRPGPADYPHATLEHIVRDARGRQRLGWSFEVVGEPVLLVFSLRGGPNSAGVTSHYQAGGTFGPGEHRVAIDLEVASTDSKPNPLDLADLWWSQVFVIRPTRTLVVHIREVWLE
jgi:hypothetical protein